MSGGSDATAVEWFHHSSPGKMLVKARNVKTGQKFNVDFVIVEEELTPLLSSYVDSKHYTLRKELSFLLANRWAYNRRGLYMWATIYKPPLSSLPNRNKQLQVYKQVKHRSKC